MELVPSTLNPLRAPPCAASAPSRPRHSGHGLPLRGWGLVAVSAVALQRQSRRLRDSRAAQNAEKAEKKSLGSRYLGSARWWFQSHFIFTPNFWEDEPIFDDHIFQMGFKHRPVRFFHSPLRIHGRICIVTL